MGLSASPTRATGEPAFCIRVGAALGFGRGICETRVTVLVVGAALVGATNQADLRARVVGDLILACLGLRFRVNGGRRIGLLDRYFGFGHVNYPSKARAEWPVCANVASPSDARNRTAWRGWIEVSLLA